jgi:hypothetical protein
MNFQNCPPSIVSKSLLFSKRVSISKEMFQNFLKDYPLSKEKRFLIFSQSDLISKAICETV